MNVLFIPTLNAGVTYWRFINFWTAAHRTGCMGVFTVCWDKKLSTIQPWQWQIKDYEQGMEPPGYDLGYKYQFRSMLNEALQQADVIVMQMPVTHEALMMFYAIRDAYPDKPLVAETDDNMLSTPKYNPAADSYGPGSMFRQTAIQQFKSADAMIVTTPSLKEVYSEFCDNIYEIPNCIDFQVWDNTRRKKKHKGVTIGWSGGASHNEDLERIRKPMKRILRKNLNVKFVMCHGIPADFREMKNVVCVDKFARIDKYPQHLASQGFDIFLAPLVDNAFNRGKSNLRWLEGSPLNVPTLASRVGHFAETIKDGKDGILFDDEKDFEKKLQKLIDDRKYRRKIAKAANARVRRDFNVDYTVLKYKEALDDIIKRGPQNNVPGCVEHYKSEDSEKILTGEVINESV